MQIEIDTPNGSNPSVFGSINVLGWAIDDFSRIAAVSIAIDGISVGTATYGLVRADVCSVFSGRENCPDVGYSFVYDSSLLPNGEHILAVTGTTASGRTSTISEQFIVAN